MSLSSLPYLYRLAPLLGAATLLAACGSAPKDHISLVPADQIAQESSKDGLFMQPVKRQRDAPGCTGQCPRLDIDSLVFPGQAALTQYIDHSLASMLGAWRDPQPDYRTLAEFESYYWQTAAPKDMAMAAAKARYRSQYLTVIELTVGEYLTGAAHGISSTRFINWDNRSGTALQLTDILQPNQQAAYTEALRQAHRHWLADNPDAQDDPQLYARLWPFQPTDNFALTDSGLVVKYDAYAIAPYAAGHPELHIPYAQLVGILQPAYIPH